MRRFVQCNDIPDVVFAGFLNQSKVSTAYAVADVLALASSSETWGLVVNEAMNFALPVVVSDKVGCAVDLVAHGENGYVFAHNKPEELARCLGSLVADPARRESFGRRSAETISRWNDDVAAKGLLAAVRAAVGPRRWLEAENRARTVESADVSSSTDPEESPHHDLVER